MIKVLDKTFAILEAVVLNSPRPLRISVLAERFGINNATCSRILKELLDTGYVVQISRQEGYAAGPRALTFANAVCYRAELLDAARPLVDAAAAEFSASVLLAERRGELRFVLYHRNGSPVLRIRLDKLAYDNLFSTATGLVLTAFAPAAEREMLIASHPTDGRELIAGVDELDRIFEERRAVFADSGRGQGIAAFPVFRNGVFAAVLGGSIPFDEWGGRGGEFVRGMEEKARLLTRSVSRVSSGA